MARSYQFFEFLSKLFEFLDSNFDLFCPTGLYIISFMFTNFPKTLSDMNLRELFKLRNFLNFQISLISEYFHGIGCIVPMRISCNCVIHKFQQNTTLEKIRPIVLQIHLVSNSIIYYSLLRWDMDNEKTPIFCGKGHLSIYHH